MYVKLDAHRDTLSVAKEVTYDLMGTQQQAPLQKSIFGGCEVSDFRNFALLKFTI